MTPNTRRRNTWAFLGRPRPEEEVDGEFAFHVDMTIQQLMTDGLTADAARAEAVRRFGDIAVVGAECRRLGRQRDRIHSRAEYAAEVRQDLAFAWRQLRRAPAFAVTAIATLAIGIGATAAVFSALYAVVLQPLPFANPDRLVQIFPSRRGTVSNIISGLEFAAYSSARGAFAGVAAVSSGGSFALAGADGPEIIDGASVTANYFDVLGVRPVMGRGFEAADDLPESPHVVLMSHSLWSHRFKGDSALVGRTLRLDGVQYTVIGVMPASMDESGDRQNLWSPLQLSVAQRTMGNGQWLRGLARLAPGVTLAQANAEATAAERVAMAHTSYDPMGVGATVRRYLDVTVGDSREHLLILLGAAAFVLLIACVNVANLVLARGTVRAREMAIRAALGAGRARLARQLLAESFMLALGGALGGLVVAYALIKGLIAVAPVDVPRLAQAHLNGSVLALTLGVMVVTSIVVGLVPAWRGAGSALQGTLRAGGRGSGGSVAGERARGIMVAAEVALAMTLLTGSGLLIRTAWQLEHVDPGFDPSHVMTARLLLDGPQYKDVTPLPQTFERIRMAAAEIPGVQAAGLTSLLPLSHGFMTTRVAPEGRALNADERIPIDIRYASGEYFGAMRMRMLEGRGFERTDNADAPQVAILSASLAAKLWPHESPIGKRVDGMRLTANAPNYLTIVGVVADVHDAALNAPPSSAMYMPYTQTQAGMWNALGRSLVLVVRTSGANPPDSVLGALRHAVATVDASIPLDDRTSMATLVAGSMATSRFNTILLATLGAIALVLAAVGLYGVVAYFVSQRTREIGVRVALGGTPGRIWSLVLQRGLRPIAIGLVPGVLLSVAAARLLRGQLFGVSAADPMTVVGVGALLLAVAVLATVVPARRAMAISPARALAAD